MAETISIDIQVLQGIFGDLTRVQQHLSGLAGSAGTIDKAMADATAGVRQSLGSVTGAANNTEAAMDTAMRGMVQDIMGPLGKSRELEQKLQDLGTKVRTSRSVTEIMALKKEIAATQRELDGVNTGGMEKRVSGAAGRMRSMFRGLAGPIAGAFAVGGVVGFTRSIVQAVAGAESFNTNMKVMLGGQQEATKMAKDLREFAIATPFDVAGLREYTTKLTSANIAQKDIIPTLDTLGNIAAGVGSDKLPEIVRAFTQMKGKGKLMGGELLQFQEAGVPILDELAKLTGEKASDISNNIAKMNIPAEMVQQALTNMTGEGGRFFNLMDAQSKTIGGQLAAAGEEWAGFLEDVGVALLPQITSAVNLFKGALDGIRSAFNWVQQHGPLVKNVLTGIAVAVGVYTAALAVNSTTTFYNTLLTKGAVVALGLQTVWTNLATAATSLWTGAQWLLNAALTANPIGVVVMAIAALVAGVIYAWYHFESFRAGVMGVWEVLKATFAWVASAVQPIIDGLVLGFQLWWAAVQATWAALVGMFQAIGAWLAHVWEGVQGFIGKVTGAFGRLADILMAPFKKVFDVLSHIPGFSKLVGFAKDIGNKVGSAFSRGQEEGIADFNAEAAGKAKGGTTNAKTVVPTGNVGAASLLGGTAPGAPAATGGAGATVSGSGGGGDKNIAMNITMNMQFGIGRDVQASARDTAEQVVAMITNKLRDAQFALG